MRHRVWLALAPLALLVGAAVPGEVMAQPAPVLRVLSYNILHGGVMSGWTGDDEDLEARLRIAVEELRALDPDIIGLQEASVSRKRGNVAERLARELGFHHVFAPALFHFFPVEGVNRAISRLMNFSEGPAILSRFPIVESQRHSLPRCNGFIDPRVMAYATIRTPWGDVGVASAHTSSGFCEADRVADLIESQRGLLPSLLMGDFNADEQSAGIRRLTERSGFVDAFRAAKPSAPGLTVWQAVQDTYPTERRRVDFVFLVPGRTVPGRVRASRVVLDAPRTLGDGKVLWPSDHYGVLAEVELAGAALGPAAHRPEPP